MALAPNQRIDQRGDRALETLEPAVELGIITPVFHQAASMSHRRAIPCKQRPDLCKTEAADDMGEIHRDLARERRSRGAARRCALSWIALRVLAKLRRALRAERRRGIAGHWSYDLNRHLGLLGAYKGALARARSGWPKTQPNWTRCGSDFGCG
jgi:hypothetical protein